jgi:hypothetical protein
VVSYRVQATADQRQPVGQEEGSKLKQRPVKQRHHPFPSISVRKVHFFTMHRHVLRLVFTAPASPCLFLCVAIVVRRRVRTCVGNNQSIECEAVPDVVPAFLVLVVFCASEAIHSISTSAPLGRPLVANVARAGGSLGKSAHHRRSGACCFYQA